MQGAGYQLGARLARLSCRLRHSLRLGLIRIRHRSNHLRNRTHHSIFASSLFGMGRNGHPDGQPMFFGSAERRLSVLA